jgi:hypothetical protein
LCPSNFDEFLNVDQLIPTTEDQMATSLDIPDSKHMVYEWEEEADREKMQPLPAHPTRKTHKSKQLQLMVVDIFNRLPIIDQIVGALIERHVMS